MGREGSVCDRPGAGRGWGCSRLSVLAYGCVCDWGAGVGAVLTTDAVVQRVHGSAAAAALQLHEARVVVRIAVAGAHGTHHRLARVGACAVSHAVTVHLTPFVFAAVTRRATG